MTNGVLTVVTMSETGQELDHSMKTWILEENVVFWLRLCSMCLLKIGLSFGMVISSPCLQFNEFCTSYVCCDSPYFLVFLVHI